MASDTQVKAIYPITSKHFKLTSIEDVQKKIQEVKKLFLSFDEAVSVFKEPIENGNIEATIQHALEQSVKDNDVVLICGSFYIMSDVREYLKYDDVFDHKEVNYN